MLRVVSPRYIPDMTFSYALKCGFLESRSTLLSNGVWGSMTRPLSNAPHLVLTIITLPAATAGAVADSELGDDGDLRAVCARSESRQGCIHRQCMHETMQLLRYKLPMSLCYK